MAKEMLKPESVEARIRSNLVSKKDILFHTLRKDDLILGVGGSLSAGFGAIRAYVEYGILGRFTDNLTLDGGSSTKQAFGYALQLAQGGGSALVEKVGSGAQVGSFSLQPGNISTIDGIRYIVSSTNPLHITALVTNVADPASQAGALGLALVGVGVGVLSLIAIKRKDDSLRSAEKKHD